MILCPICHCENSHLAVICTSCGSFVQSKVDNLDLFATVWRLIESPATAFHRIAIALHKNYTMLLACILGIGLAFALMWMLNVGNTGLSLLNLLVVGFLVGPILGFFSLMMLASVQKTVARLFRLQTTYRNAMAVISFASVPVAFSVIFVLPIEILTFGKYFFSTNPSPFLLKPISYVLLLVLDGICVVWTVMLYVIGIKVLYNINTRNALIVSAATLGIFCSVIFLSSFLLFSQHDESSMNKYFTGEPGCSSVWGFL